MSTPSTSGDADPRTHIERGAIIGETPIERIEREQNEAKEREKKYTQAQVTLNQQQLRVNIGMVIFTGLLFLTSLLSGIVAIFQARVSQQAASASQDAANASQTAADASDAAVALQGIQMRNNRLTEARQERQSQQQAADTLKQMKAETQAQLNAASASQEGASAAQSAATTAKDALVISNRSWIKVRYQWNQKSPADDPLYGRVLVSNLGQTVVTRIHGEAAYEVLDAKDSPSLALKKFHSTYDGQMIFPKVEVGDFDVGLFDPETGKARALTRGELDGLRDGTKYLAIFGYVVYADPYGVHWYQFCSWKDYDATTLPHTFEARNCTNFSKTGDGTDLPFGQKYQK